MQKTIFIFSLLALALLTGPADAQRRAPLSDIFVSDSSTTYIVFSGPISLVDVGMAGGYLVKIEANAVFVRAKKKRTATTPILIRYGSRYWMGRLVYVSGPVMQLYDFSNGTPTMDNLSGPPFAGSYAVNALMMNKAREKQAVIDRNLARLRKEREENRSVAVAENNLVLSLANIRNDQDFTYLRFKVINKTNIDYNVDFTDFQLVENSKKNFLGKKKNEGRRPLAPSGGEENQNIRGRSTGYLTYAIPLYAATQNGYLEVTLRELKGARVLVLPIPSRIINKAPTI
jgi:hypothetical protein